MTIRNYEHNQHINSEIEVTALYFRPQAPKNRLKSFPKRMVWGGREYNFAADGLRYLIQTGQQLVQLFDMTDGYATYRLRQDGSQWTLLEVRGAQL